MKETLVTLSERMDFVKPFSVFLSAHYLPLDQLHTVLTDVALLLSIVYATYKLHHEHTKNKK